MAKNAPAPAAPKPESRAKSRSVKAADFLVVACKLPAGLTIKVPDTSIEIVLHGSHSRYAIADHGMTDVKASDWQAVKDYYASHPGALWLHNGAVFAMADSDSAEDRAEDQQEIDHGFDPLDPANPGAKSADLGIIQRDGEKDPGER